jgi:hypothetical protein
MMHDTGQVIPDSVEVDGIFQSGRERGHGLVGVIPGPVEPPVHGPLYPPPHRIEQRRHGQGRPGDRHRDMGPEHLGREQHDPGVRPHQQAGDDRVADRPGNEPVDVEQAVLQDGHAKADRNPELPAGTRETGRQPGEGPVHG